MEQTGIRRFVPAVVALAIIAALVVVVAWWFVGEPLVYYAQVDNQRVADSTDESMPYEYSLDAFDEGGGRHAVDFKTSKVLTDDAYLRLEVKPLRGVISWSGVEQDEVPDKAMDAIESQ